MWGSESGVMTVKVDMYNPIVLIGGHVCYKRSLNDDRCQLEPSKSRQSSEGLFWIWKLISHGFIADSCPYAYKTYRRNVLEGQLSELTKSRTASSLLQSISLRVFKLVNAATMAASESSARVMGSQPCSPHFFSFSSVPAGVGTSTVVRWTALTSDFITETSVLTAFMSVWRVSTFWVSVFSICRNIQSLYP